MLQARPDVMLITSPNNPTGTAVDLDTISSDLRCLAGRRGGRRGLLRVRPDRHAQRAGAAARYPRLAVSRTMSKAFAFAGGRLGYLAAAPAFVDALRIVRLPYHLSSITQAVARVALAHAAEMLAAVDQLRQRATTLPAGSPLMGSRLPSPTPTSCCSADSPTGTRSGRPCSTAAC